MSAVNEEYLFEIYDIVKDYVPTKERESLAEHLYDYLNGINAPSTIFDGLAECDDYFDRIYSKNFNDDDEDQNDVDELDFDYDDE